MLSALQTLAHVARSDRILRGCFFILLVAWAPAAMAGEPSATDDGSVGAPARLPSAPAFGQGFSVGSLEAAPPASLSLQMPLETLPEPVAEGAKNSLSLADLEQLARENNPTLRTAAANVTAARGRQVQAGLYPNPVIGYSGQEMGDMGTAGMQGGFVGQQFITAGKLRLDRAIAGQEVQASQYLFEAQELRLLSDVRLRFYDALVAQRQVELTGQLVNIGQQSSDLTQRLLRALQVSQSDLLQAEIEAEEARILSNNARNQGAEAWRRLATVVGLPTLEEKPLDGQLDAEIPSYEWEETYSRVLAQNPEVAAAQARIQRARFLIQRARREIIPNVDVMAEAMHINQSGSDAATVRVGIPLPIFNRNQGNRLQAEAELIAAENGVNRIELELRDRLAMVYRRYANARQQVDRYKTEILPRAQQSIDVVRRGYEAGQVDFLALLTSQRTYVRVNLAYLDALAELRQAATLIEGQLLSDSWQSDNVSNSPLK